MQTPTYNLVDMTKRNPTWRARSGPDRPANERQDNHSHRETWVEVEDGRGGRWTVTLGDGERITSLTVHADNVKQSHLRGVPLTEIRAVAYSYMRQVEQHLDEGFRLDDALDEAEQPDLMPDGRTPVVEFLQAYRDAGPRRRPDGTIARTPRRQALSEHYGVTEYTVDKWVRFLRDEGHLEESAIQRNKRASGLDGSEK